MGLIRRSVGPTQAWFLRSSQWIGRDQRCELRVDAPRVSEVHASIAWDGRRWLLRDRNSTNGTFVNDVRLGVGARALKVGDRVAFGGETEVWLVEDVAPPGLILEPVEGGEPVHVGASALLPSTERALVTVLRSSAGAWSVETSTDAWTLKDGDEVTVDGRRLRAIVPAPHGATEEDEDASAEPTLAHAELVIGVTHHEEDADLTLKVGTVSHRILDRAPLYLLALLARARSDSPTGPSLKSADGWLGVEEVRRQLDVSPELLNLHVFRVREALRELGIRDANEIIERRKGRMRIGLDPSRLSIVRVD